MANILFTHTYFYRFDTKQWENRKPYPPLGTITAAAYLREKGHDVSLFDTNLADNPNEINPTIDRENPDYLVIYDDGFNYLTKMCLTLMRDAAFELIRIGKAHNCKVIVSSSDSTDHYEDYIKQGADVVLLGEGEASLLEVISNYEKGEDIDQVDGIAFKDNGDIKNTGRRPVIEDLDSLPMAAWDLVDMKKYQDIWYRHHGYFSLNIATTRGCPYNCNWCAKPIYGRKYNVRSPENVVDEIAFLIDKFKASYFWVCDDIFGLKPGWVREFRDLVKSRNLDFKYMMQSRVDVMMKDEDTIKALAESGLDIVWVGTESGSQKILDAMEKDIRVEQIYEARQKLRDHGIKVALFLQFGYLGETMDDIRKTEKMLLDLMPDDMGISVSYPLPGTVFHEKVKADLVNKANWTDSDDLALMFKNTYPPRFYKMLHRYLHKKFRKKQGFQKLMDFLRNPMKNNKGIVRTFAATTYYIPTTILYKWLMNRSKTEKA